MDRRIGTAALHNTQHTLLLTTSSIQPLIYLLEVLPHSLFSNTSSYTYFISSLPLPPLLSPTPSLSTLLRPPLLPPSLSLSQVDGVWPGWGHASENPRLPSTLKEKGIQFIGPTAPVMAALGDKVSDWPSNPPDLCSPTTLNLLRPNPTRIIIYYPLSLSLHRHRPPLSHYLSRVTRSLPTSWRRPRTFLPSLGRAGASRVDSTQMASYPR